MQYNKMKMLYSITELYAISFWGGLELSVRKKGLPRSV